MEQQLAHFISELFVNIQWASVGAVVGVIAQYKFHLVERQRQAEMPVWNHVSDC